jgi:hypothetical protein
MEGIEGTVEAPADRGASPLGLFSLFERTPLSTDSAYLSPTTRSTPSTRAAVPPTASSKTEGRHGKTTRLRGLMLSARPFGVRLPEFDLVGI